MKSVSITSKYFPQYVHVFSPTRNVITQITNHIRSLLRLILTYTLLFLLPVFRQKQSPVIHFRCVFFYLHRFFYYMLQCFVFVFFVCCGVSFICSGVCFYLQRFFCLLRCVFLFAAFLLYAAAFLFICSSVCFCLQRYFYLQLWRVSATVLYGAAKVY